MIRVVVLDIKGMYATIYDEMYLEEGTLETDIQINDYKKNGYLVIKITY